MSVILGIDPGLAYTGWGVIEAKSNKYRYISHGVISTKPVCAAGERLLFIYKEVKALISLYKPDEAGIESLYFAKNITSAIPVAQARGVVLLSLAEDGIIAEEYAPQQIKQSLVGKGRADKHQVQEFVKLLLGLSTIPTPDHAADALGAAICRYHHQLSTTVKKAMQGGTL